GLPFASTTPQTPTSIIGRAQTPPSYPLLAPSHAAELVDPKWLRTNGRRRERRAWSARPDGPVSTSLRRAVPASPRERARRSSRRRRHSGQRARSPVAVAVAELGTAFSSNQAKCEHQVVA